MLSKNDDSGMNNLKSIKFIIEILTTLHHNGLGQYIYEDIFLKMFNNIKEILLNTAKFKNKGTKESKDKKTNFDTRKVSKVLSELSLTMKKLVTLYEIVNIGTKVSLNLLTPLLNLLPYNDIQSFNLISLDFISIMILNSEYESKSFIIDEFINTLPMFISNMDRDGKSKVNVKINVGDVKVNFVS